MLDFDLFRRVIDEVGGALVRIDFFNYGEAFLHKRAVEMCEYIKARFPQIYLYTSTNGLALSEAQARRLVHSGIDEVTFSIDGATPDSYVKYRQRGKFEVAIANLRAMADEKRRAGRDVPFLNWRYILFIWNDSDEEMDRARTMAAGMGVDRLCWEITDHPETAYSRRFVPGSPHLDAIRREIAELNAERTGFNHSEINGRLLALDAEQREILDRAIIVALLGIAPASIDQPHGVSWLERDDAVLVLDGSVVVALLEIYRAPIRQRLEMVWLELDCGIIVLQRAVGIALGFVSDGPVVEGRRVIRIER